MIKRGLIALGVVGLVLGLSWQKKSFCGMWDGANDSGGMVVCRGWIPFYEDWGESGKVYWQAVAGYILVVGGGVMGGLALLKRFTS